MIGWNKGIFMWAFDAKTKSTNVTIEKLFENWNRKQMKQLYI